MDNKVLVEVIKGDTQQLHAVLEHPLLNPFLWKEVTELGETHTKTPGNQAFVSPMRSLYLERIEYHTNSGFSRVLLNWRRSQESRYSELILGLLVLLGRIGSSAHLQSLVPAIPGQKRSVTQLLKLK